VQADGLSWGAGQVVYVVRTSENKISSIDLDEPGDVKTVNDLTAAGLANPTSVAFVSGDHPELVVVNSQDGAKEPKLPFVLSLVPVK